MEVPPSSLGPGPAASRRPRLAALQVVLGAWLLLCPLVLPGPSALVAVTDTPAGAVLVVVGCATAFVPSLRRVESRVGLGVGVLLVLASIAVEAGPGSAAAARQINHVVVGVVLVCAWAARAR